MPSSGVLVVSTLLDSPPLYRFFAIPHRIGVLPLSTIFHPCQPVVSTGPMDGYVAVVGHSVPVALDGHRPWVNAVIAGLVYRNGHPGEDDHHIPARIDLGSRHTDADRFTYRGIKMPNSTRLLFWLLFHLFCSISLTWAAVHRDFFSFWTVALISSGIWNRTSMPTGW